MNLLATTGQDDPPSAPTAPRLRLLQRIERLYPTLRQTLRFGSLELDFTRIADPDRVLAETPHLVATADSAILDHCQRWFNIARDVIEARCPAATIIDLAS